MTEALEISQARRHDFRLAGLAFLLILLYFQVIIGLVSDWWSDSNYSHGFLVPLVSFFLVWRKRSQLGGVQKEKSYTGFAIFLGGLLMYILGTAGAEYFVARFSLVVVVFGLVLYFFGRKALGLVWFAIAYLLFMIPIPYVIYYALTFPMQLLSSKVSVLLLSAVGLPAIRQGNIIFLPNGYALEVAEACSGLRSLVSLLALGALLAHLLQKSKVKQAVVFFSTVPIAIIANFARILLTAVGAYVISPKLAEDFLHEVSGIFVFLIATLLLLGLSVVLNLFSRKKSVCTSSPNSGS